MEYAEGLRIRNVNASYYFLQSIPGIGNVSIRRLLNEFSSVLEACQATEQELSGILNKTQIQNFLNQREKLHPLLQLQKLEQEGTQYYSIEDVMYPERLRKIPDAPYGIFVKGTLPSNEKETAAIVGTRNHSGYGESMAKEYGKILALCDIGVVSGMARGIDGIAQWSVLEHGGDTYGVLGCGTDICYPPENRPLFDRIPGHGALISEYLPKTQPKAGLFPMRNRIISGLSDIVLVIEAREKSGTLITVDMALEQGKEVYALPGRVTDPLSGGCNRLIMQGANILPDPDTFYQQLQEQLGRETLEKLNAREEKLTPIEQAVYQVLDVNPLSADEIYLRVCRQHEKEQIKICFQIQDISVCLITLSMKKLVQQVNGTMFMKSR